MEECLSAALLQLRELRHASLLRQRAYEDGVNFLNVIKDHLFGLMDLSTPFRGVSHPSESGDDEIIVIENVEPPQGRPVFTNKIAERRRSV